MAIAYTSTQAAGVQNDGEQNPSFSWHAWARLKTRGITPEQAELVLKYGQMLKSPDARTRVVWQREIDFYRCRGVDLSECKGVHVVCALDGRVMTVYRKEDLYADSGARWLFRACI